MKVDAAQIVSSLLITLRNLRHREAKASGALQQQVFNRKGALSGNSCPTSLQEGVKCRAAQVVGVDERTCASTRSIDVASRSLGCNTGVLAVGEIGC